MPQPRRRAPRNPLRRYAYIVLGIAGLAVVGALASGSAVLVDVAAVLAVVLALAGAACLVEESLDVRRGAAAENAALAGAYAVEFGHLSADHQSELEHLVAQVSRLVVRVGELAAFNADLTARNADLERAAALSSVSRVRAAEAAEDQDRDGRSTVVTLPVQQFDHTPVEHARASGQ
jgi:hypothetical protein